MPREARSPEEVPRVGLIEGPQALVRIPFADGTRRRRRRTSQSASGGGELVGLGGVAADERPLGDGLEAWLVGQQAPDEDRQGADVIGRTCRRIGSDAEVHEVGVAIAIEHDRLRGQVPVRDPLSMGIGDRGGDLLHDHGLLTVAIGPCISAADRLPPFR